MVVTNIDLRIYKSSQSWNFIQICKIKDKKLCIEIKRDSYDFQSYAKISVWKDDKWSFIHSIPFTETKSSKINAYADQASQILFAEDAQNLLKIAQKILF